MYPRTVVRNEKNLNYSRCRVLGALVERAWHLAVAGGDPNIPLVSQPNVFWYPSFFSFITTIDRLPLGPCHLPYPKIYERSLIGLSIAKG